MGEKWQNLHVGYTRMRVLNYVRFPCNSVKSYFFPCFNHTEFLIIGLRNWAPRWTCIWPCRETTGTGDCGKSHRASRGTTIIYVFIPLLLRAQFWWMTYSTHNFVRIQRVRLLDCMCRNQIDCVNSKKLEQLEQEISWNMELIVYAGTNI